MNQSIARWASRGIGIGMVIFHLYALGYRSLTPWLLYSVHFMLAMALIFMRYPSRKGSKELSPGVIDWVLVLLSVLTSGYIILNLQPLTFRAGVFPTTMDLVFGTIAIVVTIEATRRTMGWSLPIVALIFISYAFVGKWLPMRFGHSGYSYQRLVSFLYSMEGIFSTPIGTSATYIFLFILFSALLYVSQAGQFFMDLAMGTMGSRPGGPAKVSVVSSALFGSIMGSGPANVMATGTFTIPLMKRFGYDPAFAGAVEAAASNGGQIMPPVMGAAAFILAELVGVPYLAVCAAALIPAVLYFFSIFLSVDAEARKKRLTGIDSEDLPVTSEVLKKGWHLFVPLVVLLGGLIVGKVSTIRVVLWGIISLVFVTFFRKDTRLTGARVIEAFEQCAVEIAPIAAACACAGIVVGVSALTGLGIKLASIIVALAGRSLFFALVLTMFVSIILGMGMPTTAAYITCAAVVAPALTMLEMPPLIAHLFIFYYACMSGITPPVALNAYAASGIAGADPMKIGFVAWKLGLVAFVVPFMFAYGPSLLAQGAPFTVVTTAMTALVGVAALVAGLHGYLWRVGKIGLVSRLVFIAASVLLVKPGFVTDTLGLILIVLGVFLGMRFPPMPCKTAQR